MLKCRTTLREFLDGGEGIIFNVLADRLNRLEGHGIIERQPPDGRRHTYPLTEKGDRTRSSVAGDYPLGSAHEATAAPASELAVMTGQRALYLVGISTRWESGRDQSI
jgi:DNA-binding HxlR family transcriptional regulator